MPSEVDASSAGRRRVSVRLALALALLATAAPIVAGFAYADITARSHAEARERASATSLARVGAAGVADFVGRSRALMQAIARRPLIAELRAGRCDRVLSEVPILHPDYANIGVINPSGRVRCSAVAQPGTTDVSRTAWFREASRTKRFTVGDPFVGPITHRWVSVLVLPLRSHGAVAGYLALPIDLVHFQGPLHDLGLPPDSVIGAVDPAGTVVARSPGAATWVGRRVPDFAISAAVAGKTEGEFRGADGVQRLVGIAPVPGTPWYVYAGVSASRALASAHSVAVGVGVAAAAAILIGALVALLLTRGIVGPIRELAAAARRVAAGDYTARAPVRGPSEIALAAQQFNEMVEAHLAAEDEHRRLTERLARSQKLEALGQLATGVAHDFNNVLTAIRGYAAHALELAERPELRSDLVEVARAAEMASAVTAQLLAFGRRSSPTPDLVDLAELLSSSAGLLQRLLGDDVSLDLEVAGSTVVQADRAQLEQVLLNLAVNARQAMPEGGRLSVRLAERTLDGPLVVHGETVEPGRYAELEVADTGPGIPAETVDRIFEPFFTTKSESAGTGLGLSTVLAAVRESGGVIWYEDAEGGGACFRILLPATTALPLETPPAGEPLVLAEGLRVLVVEDERSVRKVIELMLQAAGCEVTAPDTPQEALALLRAGGPPPDAVVTDWSMPDLRPGEFARTARELYPDVPILVVSGGLAEPIGEGDRIADDFVAKPFTTDVLVGALRRAIDRTRSADSRS